MKRGRGNAGERREGACSVIKIGLLARRLVGWSTLAEQSSVLIEPNPETAVRRAVAREPAMSSRWCAACYTLIKRDASPIMSA